jgi:thiosulfate/3-mercaptopyruvate sulfurtransferase
VKNNTDLASTGWLLDHLQDPGLVILHCSYFLGVPEWNPKASYSRGHIPGARLFDVDKIAQQGSPLPHMMPSADSFARAAGQLGIGNDDRVVVYDDGGVRPAFRVWWTFKTFGHDRVAVLDGGLGKWLVEEKPLTTDVPEIWAKDYTADFHRENVACKKDLLDNLESNNCEVLDARGPGRFTGAEEEPRPGMRSGHIPGSRNLYYGSLLNQDGTLKSDAKLKSLVQKCRLKESAPVITSCGSGMTAAILAFVLDRLGRNDIRLYDGSWADWGSDPNTPVETGGGF